MKARTQAIWGDGEEGIQVLTGPAADKIRELCKQDFRFFYLTVIDQAKRGLGRVHDFLIDFMRLEELPSLPPSACHSPLVHLLTQRDAQKDFAERWLYWPTLTSQPEIQDGPQGKLADLFAGNNWRGMMIRIAGDGNNKCCLMPRGHLKSTIANQAHTLWEIIRDPSLRHLVRCQTHRLACDFVRDIKFHFESNKLFQSYFGYLVPPLRGKYMWNQDAIQVVWPERRGKEPTLMALGWTGK